MRYVKVTLVIFLLLFVGIVSFIVHKQKQVKEMQHVARNLFSSITFQIKDAEAAVNYLHLSTTQVMENKKRFEMPLPLKESYKDGRYAYSLYESQTSKPLLVDKANLLGYSDEANDTRYMDEKAAALFLSENFKLVSKQNKNFAWIYYFSKHHFSLIYPYISAKDFAFDMELEKEPFFAYATPKLNPEAKLFFTPLYTDLIGKGLMVTMGKPVYADGEFLGTVDIDITLNHLDNILFDLDTLKNKSLIFNDKLQILGSNNLIKDFNRSKVYSAAEYLPRSLLKGTLESDNIFYSDGNYIYINKIPNSPFTFIYFQSAILVWLQTIAYLLPFLLLFALFIIVFELYEKARKSMEALEHQATKDYLSGAYNRRYFFDIGSAIFLKAQRRESAVAVVMIDIDDFKQVNDRYGHEAGDKGIVQVEEILENNLRKSDLFARFGGEEFCILLDDISYKDVSKLLEKIRKEFEVSVITHAHDNFSFTVSFGVAYGMLDSLESMINLADKALYKSRNKGKNCVTIYEAREASGEF